MPPKTRGGGVNSLNSDETKLLNYLKYLNLNLGSDSDYSWSQKIGDYYYLLNSSGTPLQVSSARASDYIFITKDDNTISYGLDYNYQNVSASNFSLVVGIEAIQVANISATISNVKAKFEEDFGTSSTETHTVSFVVDGTTYTGSSVAYAGSVAFSNVNSAVSSAVSDSTFNGFALEQDGYALITKSTTYNHTYISSDGLSLCNITEDVTLYLGESSKTYTVDFVNLGQTLQSSQVTAGEKATFTGTEPTYTSGDITFKFRGWLSSVDGKIYASDNLPKITQNCTFTAQFEQKQNVTVTFNANGGECDETSRVVYVGDAYGELPTPARVGYNFGGWYTDAENGTKVESTTKITNTTSHTLYAHWNAVEYIISYNYDGGSAGRNAPASASYDSVFEISAPSKVGYDFTSWIVENGLESEYAKIGADANSVETAWDGSETAMTFFKNLRSNEGTVNFKATWTAKTFTITFDAKDGTCDTTTKTVTYDQTFGELPTPVSNTSGYSFVGWFDNEEFSGDAIKSDTVVKILEDTALYAKYAEVVGYLVSPTVSVSAGSTYSCPTVSLQTDNFFTRIQTAMSAKSITIAKKNIASFTFSKTLPSTYSSSSNKVSVGTNSNESSDTYVEESGVVDVVAYWTRQSTTISSKISSYSNSNKKTEKIYVYDIYVYCPGKIIAPKYCEQLFANYQNLKSVDLTPLDTSETVSMGYMFNSYVGWGLTTSADSANSGAVKRYSELTSITLGDYWDTSKVYNMQLMFMGLSSMTSSVLNACLAKFNTSSLVNMYWMFGECGASEVDFSGFDFSNVENMQYLFMFCYNLTTVTFPTAPIAREIKNFGGVFSTCEKLTSLDLSVFDLTNMTSTDSCFYYNTVLTTIVAPRNVPSGKPLLLRTTNSATSFSTGSGSATQIDSTNCSTDTTLVTFTR